jgi:ABC-type branched-subunit amino acid transport system substrate-binding protein
VQDVTVSTLAGDGHWGYRDGPGAQARFKGVVGLATDSQGNVYVAEHGHRIRRISPDGTVSTMAGTGIAGHADGPASTAQFNMPRGLTVDVAGSVYVADTFNYCIRVIRPARPGASSSEGTVSTLAGVGEAGYRDGPAAQAQFDRPTGVALGAGGIVYVADSGNNRVRVISRDGVVSTLAGNGERGYRDGPADQAQFDGPQLLAMDLNGDILASDEVGFELRGNHVIRRITPDGTVSTLAGIGQLGLVDGPVAEAGFNYPGGLDVDAAGNVYISDENNQRVRVITPQGMVYTVAGRRAGYADGPGPEAEFLWPQAIALDGAGRLYVADFASNRIRVVHLPQALAAAPLSATSDPYVGEDVVKIGFVDEAERGAFYGATTRNAVQLAIDEANAAGGVTVGGVRHIFALVRAQDWDQPPEAGARAAARALVDQGVVAVVGHVLSENSIAGAEVYGPAGVAMVSAVSSDPRLTQAGWPTVYRVTSNDAFMAPTAARMTYEELGIRRVVLLGEADPHVRTAMDAWQKAFEPLGGEVLGSFEGGVEFSDQVMVQLKTLAPEAVIFFPARELSITRAAQQVLDTGAEPIIVGVESFTVYPDFVVTLGDAAEGIYDALPGTPRVSMPGYTLFADRYRAAGFAIIPDPDHFLGKWVPFAYDAAGVIIAAILQSAETGEVTRESVAAAMETFRHEPYQGVTGKIQFDEYGDLRDQPVYFQKVVNGQWVDIMPEER